MLFYHRWKGLLFTSLRKTSTPRWIEFLEDRMGWLNIDLSFMILNIINHIK